MNQDDLLQPYRCILSGTFSFFGKVDCYDITWIEWSWRRGTIVVTLLSIDDDASSSVRLVQWCAIVFHSSQLTSIATLPHSPVFNPCHCAMYDVYWFLITLHRFGNVCFKMNLLIILSKVRKEHVQIDETIDRRQFVICLHPWTPFLSILSIQDIHTRWQKAFCVQLTRQKLD